MPTFDSTGAQQAFDLLIPAFGNDMKVDTITTHTATIVRWTTITGDRVSVLGTFNLPPDDPAGNAIGVRIDIGNTGINDIEISGLSGVDVADLIDTNAIFYNTLFGGNDVFDLDMSNGAQELFGDGVYGSPPTPDGGNDIFNITSSVATGGRVRGDHRSGDGEWMGGNDTFNVTVQDTTDPALRLVLFGDVLAASSGEDVRGGLDTFNIISGTVVAYGESLQVFDQGLLAGAPDEFHLGGNDGDFYGDVLTVLSGGKVTGGNDTFTATATANANQGITIYADANALGMGSLTGGSDTVDLSAAQPTAFATVFGDLQTLREEADASSRLTAGADTITGTAGDDFLYGDIEGTAAGADTSIIQFADDTIKGGDGNDQIFGDYSLISAISPIDSAAGGNDIIDGGAGDDDIQANGGNDMIDGGTGADFMAGGAGNDVYKVDEAGDSVSEGANDGDDIVDTTVTYNVPVNVEVLRMQGTDDIDSTGTDARDQIFGNSGNNTIDGAGGFDVMAGGAGNDTYAVDDSLDAVIEEAGGGEDAVYSSVDYIISGNQEIETGILTESAVVLRGSDSDNQLFGNDNVNVLEGKGGTDYLLGLGGDDIFQVSLEANATDLDVFGDFEGAGVVGGDRIALDASIWGADGIVYQVSQTSFIVATAQNTNQQQFIIANLTDPTTTLIAGDDYYFG